MEQLTATAGAVGSTFVNMGMQVLDGATAGVRGPSAQAMAWRADAMAAEIGHAELRTENEQLRQSLTRALGERDGAIAAMLRGCKEEIAGLLAEKVLAKQQQKQWVADSTRRRRLALVRDPGLWQPVASDFFKKCLVPNDDAVVLLVDLIPAFARFLTVSSLDRRLSHVSHQDLRNFCDELENVKPKTLLIIEPFKDVLEGLGMTPRNVRYVSNTSRWGYLVGCGLKGYSLCCGNDVVCRRLFLESLLSEEAKDAIRQHIVTLQNTEEAAAGGEDTRVAPQSSLPVAWQRVGLTERPRDPHSARQATDSSAAVVNATTSVCVGDRRDPPRFVQGVGRRVESEPYIT